MAGLVGFRGPLWLHLSSLSPVGFQGPLWGFGPHIVNPMELEAPWMWYLPDAGGDRESVPGARVGPCSPPAAALLHPAVGPDTAQISACCCSLPVLLLVACAS